MSGLSKVVSGHSAGEARRPLFSVDEGWVKTILPDVEAAINRLVDDFLKNPYLHRVEHSLHCELYGHLLASGKLGETEDYDLVRPRRVQKEWPETIRRPKNKNMKTGIHKRGNFDLVVLGRPANGQSRSLRPDQFLDGLIKPGIVIEIGLDYDLAHLEEDLEKLTNSEVRHGYLIHLSRLPHRSGTMFDVEAAINNLIAKEKSDEGIKIAYAQLVEDGKALRYRKLGEPTISRFESRHTPL